LVVGFVCVAGLMEEFNPVVSCFGDYVIRVIRHEFEGKVYRFNVIVAVGRKQVCDVVVGGLEGVRVCRYRNSFCLHLGVGVQVSFPFFSEEDV
jgi:hypothetical protein